MQEKVRILVADDELPVTESLKMILEIKDYEVITFNDGPAAIASLDKERYDIAIVDMNFKNLDPKLDFESSKLFGLEILKRIKEKDPSIEVIIITAYSKEILEEHNFSRGNAITLGAMEYINKPFMMEEVYTLIDRGLRKRRERATKQAGPPNPPPEIH